MSEVPLYTGFWSDFVPPQNNRVTFCSVVAFARA